MKTQINSTGAARASRPMNAVPVVELPIPRTAAIPTTPDEYWLPTRGPRRVSPWDRLPRACYPHRA